MYTLCLIQFVDNLKLLNGLCDVTDNSPYKLGLASLLHALTVLGRKLLDWMYFPDSN